MTPNELNDLAIHLGALEEKIVHLPEWEALQKYDPALWEHCDTGYDSVTTLINKLQERLDWIRC